MKDETPSHDVCLIDIGDQLTDDEGNVEFELSSDKDPITVTCGTGTHTFSSAAGSKSTTFWAWTGSQGDELDEDTDRATLEDVARPVGRAGPDYARISGGLPTGDELAKMGETVTFTVQLRTDTSGRDGTTLDDDEAVGPDRTNNVYLLQIERYQVTRVAGTDSDYGDDADVDAGRTKTGTASVAGGLFEAAPGDWNLGPQVGAAYYTPEFPNADGEFTVVLENQDYHAATNNTDVGVRFTLRPFGPSNDLLDANPLPDIVVESSTNSVSHALPLEGIFGTDVVSGGVIFSDDPSDPHSATAESESYRIISGSRTPNTVTVKVVDQYGDPQRSVDISVNSDLDVVDRDATEPADGVLYPEQVDITVQANENADSDADRGENTLIDPKARLISLIAAEDVPDGSGDTVRTTRTVALRMTTPDTTNPAGTVAEVAQDDVIGAFKTRRNGTYRIGYAYVAATEAQTEMITPQSAQVFEVAIAKAGTGDTGTLSEDTDAVERDAVTGMITPGSGTRIVTTAEVGSPVAVYWTQLGTSGQSDSADNVGMDPEPVPVYVTDVGRRTVVANEERLDGADDTDNPMAYFYDEDDVFIIENIGASFEMFEEALGLTTRADGCEVDTVSWENYTFYRDPNRFGARPGRVDRTIWEITLS